MKILKKCLIFILSICLVLPIVCVSRNNVKCKAYESDIEIKTNIENYLKLFIEYGVEQANKTLNDRYAGTEKERNASNFIKDKLDLFANFEAVNNDSTIDGISTFNFVDVDDGNLKTSQNIIYVKKCNIQNAKKVILATHYDSARVYDIKQENNKQKEVLISVDSVNDGASSVATLLALAEYFNAKENLPFDIEFIFFGASNNNYDGAESYVKGLSETERNNILLMLNLDRIGLGDKNYFYVNEFKTPQENYFSNVLSDNFNAVKAFNTQDIGTSSPNGLDYTHIGLESDHAKFMKANINTLYLFSGYYEQMLTVGLKEFKNKDRITYTKDDNYDNIYTSFPTFYENLINVYKNVITLLEDENFVSNMVKENGSKAFYGFWNNQKLAVFITAMLLIVLLFIYYLIFLKLQKESRKKIKTGNIDGIIVKISKNINEQSKELNDLISDKVKKDTDDVSKNK